MRVECPGIRAVLLRCRWLNLCTVALVMGRVFAARYAGRQFAAMETREAAREAARERATAAGKARRSHAK
jgi:hypothetical protein